MLWKKNVVELETNIFVDTKKLIENFVYNM